MKISAYLVKNCFVNKKKAIASDCEKEDRKITFANTQM